MGPPWFSGATHKEPACFAAERGPDLFGHTRALEGPFFDSKSEGQGLGLEVKHFSGATHKEPPCFAAERGPDPFGHTRALAGPFFSELGWELSSAAFRVMWPFSGATHKERPCFAAERGPDSLEHSWFPKGLVGPHTKKRPVLLQNVAPTPLGTHEHSGVHFFLSWDGNLVVLGLGSGRGHELLP